VLAVVKKEMVVKCQILLPEERDGMRAAAEMIKQEIPSWLGVVSTTENDSLIATVFGCSP
jgi:hypothetical protein